METSLISNNFSSFSYYHTQRISITKKVQKINRTTYVNKNSVVLSNYKSTQNSKEVVKLHFIIEIISDRLALHKNVGIQRDNWNNLLLSSINMMTLSATTMVGLASVALNGAESSFLALKVSSTILYMAATGLLLFMNKVQPSQLAEEQRNATRFFKQIEEEFRTRLALGNVNDDDVDEAMEKVLALDKAFPLPLMGSMIEKFPKNAKPSIWWPQKKNKENKIEEGGKYNGWNQKLEEEMKQIVKILKKKDMENCLNFSEKVLKFNKILAFSGPVLTGFATIGSVFLGSVNGSWPVMVGILCGGLASVVNMIEHGGQVGMVFEFYRSSSGSFKLMEETIEVNINEEDYCRRENGELFEIKVALQLGRSVLELREFSDVLSSKEKDDDCEEFASKNL